MYKDIKIIKRRKLQPILASLGRATLIEAPTGFGKTCFLKEIAEVCDQENSPNITITLTPRDNNLGSFEKTIFKAFSKNLSFLSPFLHTHNFSENTPSLDQFVEILEDAIDLSSSSFFLLFDNFQFIDNPQILSFFENISYFETIKLAIASRKKIRLNLNHLSLNSEKHIIGVEHLKFDIDAMRALFHDQWKLELRPGSLYLIWQNLDGWPGLAAALASQHVLLENPLYFDNEQLLTFYSGTCQTALDYLDEYFRSVVDEQMLFFLACLSKFSVKNKTIAAALSGHQYSKFLHFMQEHPLIFIDKKFNKLNFSFAKVVEEYLQTIASNDPNCDFEKICELAAFKMMEDGNHLELAECYFLLENHMEAANYLSHAKYAAISNGNIPQLIKWLEKLPQQFVESDANLLFLKSWVLYFQRDWKKIEQCNQRLGALESEHKPDLNQYMFIGDLLAASQKQSAGEFLKFLEELPKEFVEDLPIQLKAIFFNVVTDRMLAIGDISRVETYLQKALKSNLAAQSQYGLLIAKIFEVILLVKIGSMNEVHSKIWQLQFNLDNAKNDFTQKLIIAIDGIGSNIAGESEQAYLKLTDAIHSIQDLSCTYLKDLALQNYCLLLVQNKLTDSALYIIEKFTSSTVKNAGEFAALSRKTEIIRLLTLANDFTAAQKIMDKLDESKLELLNQREVNSICKLLVAQKKYHIAAKYLKATTNNNFSLDMIESSILLAEVCRRQGDDHKAIQFLEQALLTTSNDVSHVFTEHHSESKKLLEQYLPQILLTKKSSEKKQLQSFVIRLNEHLKEPNASPSEEQRTEKNANTTKQVHDDLIEPLSEKENIVFGFVSQGLTNKQIAEEMHISVNTVKWHVRHILEKYGVKKRTQIIAKYNQELSTEMEQK